MNSIVSGSCRLQALPALLCKQYTTMTERLEAVGSGFQAVGTEKESGLFQLPH